MGGSFSKSKDQLDDKKPISVIPGKKQGTDNSKSKSKTLKNQKKSGKTRSVTIKTSYEEENSFTIVNNNEVNANVHSVLKLKTIVHHIVWRLHTRKCKKASTCKFQNCKTIKENSKHMDCCKKEDCQIPICYTYKKIEKHWKTCNRDMCPACLLGKSMEHRRTCEELIPLDDKDIITVIRQEINGESEKMGKKWHETFPQECRDSIVQTLITLRISITSTKSLLALEPILPDLIRCGRKVENFFYELADSKIDYSQKIDNVIIKLKDLPLNITLPLLSQCLRDPNETFPQSVSSVENSFDKKHLHYYGPMELRKNFMSTFKKLYNEPESFPFRKPVDPKVLEIPNYLKVVNKPMDLWTIKHKLDMLLYTDPWKYIDDVWTMFNNAWIYNSKTSKTYRYCTKLSEIFEQEMDISMHVLAYCCGRKFTFEPGEIICYANGRHICTISREEKYYSYQGIYNFCEKCFDEIPGRTVLLGDDPPAEQTCIRKKDFKKKKNEVLACGTFVSCTKCSRKVHEDCVMPLKKKPPLSFTCEGCLTARDEK